MPPASRPAGNPFPLRLLIRCLLLALLAAILWRLFAGLEYAWDWSAPWRYRALYLRGFALTVAVSAAACALSLLFGVLAGLARVSGNVLAEEASALYVAIFRGTPLLVQIYIFYFCVAAAVNYDNPLVVGAVALAFFSGAYIAEMVRAGIESIDKGQWEAARATGLGKAQTLRHVIFPQALRRIVPPLTGQFASIVKDSSLLSVISARELTKAAEMVNATTFKTFEAYLPLALLYLALTYPLSRLTARLERRIGS
jgi:polar amino acid transport system permease protein